MPQYEDDEYDDRPRGRRRDDDDDDRSSRRRDRDDDRRSHRRDDDEYEDGPRRGVPTGNGYAMASLTLGVLSFLLFCLTGIPAIVFGILGLKRASQNGRGRGIAIAGIVCAVASTVLAPALLLPAVQKVREAALRAKNTNNAKQIGLALHGHVDFSQKLPYAYSTDDALPGLNPAAVPMDRRLMSWRTAILPYMEQGGLFQLYDARRPWNDPRNQVVASTVVPPYVIEQPPTTETRFRVFTGPNTLFVPGGPRLNFATIPDGASNTILVVESAESGPWAEPRDLELTANGPLPQLGLPHQNGAIVLLVDGSVRYFKKPHDERILRSMIDPADGQGIPADFFP